jgi:hypothetical protein
MLDSFDLALEAERKSARTRSIYRDAARWLAGTLTPGVGWPEVRQDVVHLRTFFAMLTREGYSINYATQMGRSLQQFLTWLSAEEDLPNPFEGRASARGARARRAYDRVDPLGGI